VSAIIGRPWIRSLWSSARRGAATAPPPDEPLGELEPDEPPPTYTYCTGWLAG
jgi:hypothetical protein